MADRVTLVSRDGVRVFVEPADVERFTSAGFSEPKPKEPAKKAPATRKRAPRKSTKTETE